MSPGDVQAAVSNLRAGLPEITGLDYGEAMELQRHLDDVRRDEKGTSREGRTPETRVCPDGDDWKVRVAVRQREVGHV